MTSYHLLFHALWCTTQDNESNKITHKCKPHVFIPGLDILWRTEYSIPQTHKHQTGILVADYEEVSFQGPARLPVMLLYSSLNFLKNILTVILCLGLNNRKLGVGGSGCYTDSKIPAPDKVHFSIKAHEFLFTREILGTKLFSLI